MQMMRFSAFAAMLLPMAAAAQEHPTTNCPFDGFSATPKLVVTVASSVGYYGCSVKSGCLTTNINKDQPIVLFQKSAEWICGYVDDKDGATPAWISAKEVREVGPDPIPPVTAWLGTWRNGANRIVIKRPGDPYKLTLVGHATWHGRAGVEHSGDVTGDVTPSGDHIHYSEGGESCAIDLTLFGNYMVANDNDRCGGMNVRFWGIWRRSVK